MFYKVIAECGHVGAGNSIDGVWFIKGENPLTILEKVVKLPRIKRKETSISVKLIKQISRKEYINGIILKKKGGEGVYAGSLL